MFGFLVRFVGIVLFFGAFGIVWLLKVFLNDEGVQFLIFYV